MKRYLSVILALVICLSSIITVTAADGGTWKQNGNGWWYEYADGSYEIGWATIGGNRYYFDADGYAATGWRQIKNKWYLFDSQSCAMLTSWQQVGDEWYYFYSNGEMLTGWQKTDTGYSYFASDGTWVKDTYYKDSYIFGIDVSKWQGDIDWQALKNEGVEFAFVRVGYGDRNIDPRFAANMKAAEEAGIPVGVYFYSEATSEVQALGDAQFVIDSIDGYLVSYPVVIDVEDNGTQGSLSKNKLGNIVKAFSDEIAAAGYTPMLYCNENWYKNKIDTSKLTNVYKWIARWNGKYDTEISRDVWQVGETGRLNGINGYVDFDFALTDFSKIVTPRSQKSTSYVPQNGVWIDESGGRWYGYISGGYAIGWKLIGGKWYYFNANGWLQTGWQLIGSKWYYFNGDGVMATGWTNDGKAYYYLEESGAWSGHQKNDITDPTVCEPVPQETIPSTCISEGVAEHYKCDVCGKLYSDAEGENQISIDAVKIPQVEHTLSHTDFAQASCTVDGNVAYDKCDVCKKLFIDGVEVNENEIVISASHTIVHINEVAPQIETAGTKAHDKCTACEKLFINDTEVTEAELIIAALPKYVQGWKQNTTGWWYQYADGSYPKNCWDKINNKWYYFNSSGYMVTGWIKDNGIWYYTDKSGAMVTKWQAIGGKWYYFNQSGAMQTGWLKLDATWYYLNNSGAMQTEWALIGGKWYYFNNSGAMLTGTHIIGGKTYKFNLSGAWIG